jgi:hypothetical protein
MVKKNIMVVNFYLLNSQQIVEQGSRNKNKRETITHDLEKKLIANKSINPLETKVVVCVSI